MAKSLKTRNLNVDELMDIGLEALGLYVQDAREMLQANSGDSNRAATLAGVLTKVAAVQAEQRRSEAAQRKADEELSPETLLDRVRRMSARDRRELLRQMQGIDADAGKSGLA